MTRAELWLIGFGLLDVTIVGWLIVSALQNGNVSGGRGSPLLIYRDRNPVSFWSTIAFYAVIGLGFLILIAHALIISQS
jgi:hypothetical protein